MHRDIEERIKEEASYFLANNSTTRKTAKAFGVSKSLIHKDLSKRLAIVNPQLHIEVLRLLDHNKEVRHIRGGITTQKRYKKKMA
ncbi:sporulation transcriptional regulator SpoIIID [Clostridium cadaveris]|uniref:sporulation transcriptional regulator SpoIIID n=1 Tax=Clostridium cadaveris TaxID=1529 RepID=UPI000C06D8AA|nr:sporulation transcriptional regulator SpoIIID [Clostridium cadaveris]NWK12121.1 sporulation transcriptional regulator SpoIIID [Clostridium cadaveris]